MNPFEELDAEIKAERKALRSDVSPSATEKEHEFALSHAQLKYQKFEQDVSELSSRSSSSADGLILKERLIEKYKDQALEVLEDKESRVQSRLLHFWLVWSWDLAWKNKLDQDSPEGSQRLLETIDYLIQADKNGQKPQEKPIKKRFVEFAVYALSDGLNEVFDAESKTYLIDLDFLESAIEKLKVFESRWPKKTKADLYKHLYFFNKQAGAKEKALNFGQIASDSGANIKTDFERYKKE